ncbi:GGDEF domain-containing protein [Collimonas sp.]|uniref:GGDEF domain-containing protein n=1 Tax=Collimonas sp. TaxID=1963772 RepID=UPI002CCB5262|nr:GGDEF domain-containing protein [Collimonas sp.]HWX01912.1 GGDEF domain-containing protein [Collimonas sp.]
MSLNRLFGLISLLLMLLFLTLAGIIVDGEWKVYQRSTESIPAIRKLHLALQVEENLIAERGVSNFLLQQDLPDDAAMHAKLAPARAASDRSLHNLRQALQERPGPWLAPVMADVLLTERRLAAARADMDSLAARSKAQRDPEAVAVAAAMIMSTLNVFAPAVAALSSIAVQADQQFHDGVDSAQLASSLRNVAGQMVSILTAPVVARRPLTAQERYTFAKLSGQADQLYAVIEMQLRAYSHKPDFRTALQTIRERPLGEGLDLLTNLFVIGRSSGGYGLGPDELIASYVPTMAAIPHLRDLIIMDMIREAEQRNLRARYVLLAAVGLAVLALGIFFLLLRVIRRRVLRPILDATDLFVSLANERLITSIPTPRYDDEIGDMMRAIHVLKAHSQERICLEKEREEMIAQLQAASDTDFLTGLLNRRAFFAQGEQQFGIAQRYRRQLTLILMDVDHFKAVNDQHGHLAGDQVLCKVAELSRRYRRKVDLLARYGGEEFLLMLPEIDLEQGRAVAEKLRVEIGACDFQLDDGVSLKISASFGVVSFDHDDTLESLIVRADQALYKAKDGGRNRVTALPREPGQDASRGVEDDNGRGRASEPGKGVDGFH